MYVLANCKLPVQIFCLFFYWTFFLLSLSRGSSLCILDSSLRQLHALQYFLSAFGFSLHFLHHVFQKADVFNLFCFWGKKKKRPAVPHENSRASIRLLISAQPLVFLLDFYLSCRSDFLSLIQPTDTSWWKPWAEKANEVSRKPYETRSKVPPALALPLTSRKETAAFAGAPSSTFCL